jgi:hypothetical protein
MAGRLAGKTALVIGAGSAAYSAAARGAASSLIALPSALSTTWGTCHSLFAGMAPQRLVTPAIHSGL